MKHGFIAGTVCLIALAAAGATVSAEDRGFAIGSRPVWFVNAGVTGGGALGVDTRGGFVGGELGLVRIRDARVLGLYADAFYDFGIDRTYVTAGPELAWIRRSPSMPLALGIDGGAALRLGDGRAVGATGRVFLNVAGAVSIFARYAYLDDDADRHVIHVGVTLKFPLGPPFGAGTRR